MTIPNNPYSFASVFFSSAFLISCDVEPVASICTDLLPFTLPTTSSDTECSYSARLTAELTPVCTPAKTEQLNSLVNENGDCDAYLDNARQSCSVDDNGDFCLATFTQESDYNNLKSVSILPNAYLSVMTFLKVLYPHEAAV